MGYVKLLFSCVFRCNYHYFSTYRNCVNQWSKGNFSSTQNQNITFQTLELLISLALMQYSSQITPLCWPCLTSPRRPTSRAPYTWRNPPYILADCSWKKPSSFWNRDHLSLLMKVLVCPCPSGKVRPVCQEIWHKLQGLARPGERPTGNNAKQTFLCTSFYNLNFSSVGNKLNPLCPKWHWLDSANRRTFLGWSQCPPSVPDFALAPAIGSSIPALKRSLTWAALPRWPPTHPVWSKRHWKMPIVLSWPL